MTYEWLMAETVVPNWKLVGIVLIATVGIYRMVSLFVDRFFPTRKK